MDPITPTPQPTSEVTAPITTASNPEQPTQPLNAQANKKSLFLIIGIIILVLLLVGLSLMLLLQNNTSLPTQKQLSNTQTTPSNPPPALSTITPTGNPASLVDQASQIDTGDNTTDIIQIQNDASGL